MTVRWTAGAAQHLEDIFDTISRDNPDAARRTIRRILRVVDDLQLFPLSGRQGYRVGTLERVVSGLPYLVVYRIKNGDAEILRVLHAARLR